MHLSPSSSDKTGVPNQKKGEKGVLNIESLPPFLCSAKNTTNFLSLQEIRNRKSFETVELKGKKRNGREKVTRSKVLIGQTVASD